MNLTNALVALLVCVGACLILVLDGAFQRLTGAVRNSTVGNVSQILEVLRVAKLERKVTELERWRVDLEQAYPLVFTAGAGARDEDGPQEVIIPGLSDENRDQG